MPRGTQLSDTEKGKIQAYKEDGHSIRWIAKKIERSPGVVINFLRNKDVYGKNNARRGPTKLDDRTKRQIQATAKQSTMGSRRIRADLELNVSHLTVWRAIKKSPNLLWKKMKKCPRLTVQHKTARVEWARQMITERTDWKLVCVLFVFCFKFF